MARGGWNIIARKLKIFLVNPDTKFNGKKQSAHSNSNFLDILTPLPSTPSMRKGDDGDGEKNGKNRGGDKFIRSCWSDQVGWSRRFYQVD